MRAEAGRPSRSKVAILFLSGLLTGLGAAFVLPLSRSPLTVARALSEADVRQRAVELLVAEGRGIWDSHPDPDVGKVLQPGLDMQYLGAGLRTNALGLRERNFAPEKPADTLRVVLLGDSYFFGYKIEAEERVGVHLERFLGERLAGWGGRVECLHIALPSWNIRSECAFLRRQIDALDPDLVVQMVVPNDLGDVSGVRGFGVLARHSPQFRRRAESIVALLVRTPVWGVRAKTALQLGLDHESRSRYERAAAEIEQLARVVTGSGGEYLLLASWSPNQWLVPEQLAPRLDPRRLAYVSGEFMNDAAHWVGPADNHWNALGSERIAMMLYGLIRERELLPGFELAAWPLAEEWAKNIHERGDSEAHARGVRASVLDAIRFTSRLRFGEAEERLAKQVYAGVLPSGEAGPYASVVLSSGGGTLRVTGTRIGGPELAGGRAQVLVEEFALGEIALGGRQSFDESWRLPPATASRDYLNVRIESDDWITRWSDGRSRSVSLEIDTIELVTR